MCRFTTLAVLVPVTSFYTGTQAAETELEEAKVAGSEVAEAEPLWELGVGAGALYGPDYPASSEHHLRGLALPYVVYRGDMFRIGDGQTARAIAYESDRLEFDLSFLAAFDADSEHNELRGGMPDIDYLFQIGPQLTIKLADFRFEDESHSRLSLALQARAVFSSDLTRIDQRGYVFEPMLRYRHYDWLTPNLDVTVSLRPTWGSEHLHGYFFDVDSEYVTPERVAFSADSGYFGTGLNVYASYQLTEKSSVFFGLQTSFHHGAANTNSPLFEDQFTVGFGGGFIWSLFASERLVTE
ncbi:MAG: MipA/OmpV family protein [Pseudohongiellaceae bacterium]